MEIQEIFDKLELLYSDRKTLDKLVKEIVEELENPSKETIKSLLEKLISYDVIEARTSKVILIQLTSSATQSNRRIVFREIVEDEKFNSIIKGVIGNIGLLISNILEYLTTTLKTEIDNLEFSDKGERVLALKRSLARLYYLIDYTGDNPIAVEAMSDVTCAEEIDYHNQSMEYNASIIKSHYKEMTEIGIIWITDLTRLYNNNCLKTRLCYNLKNFMLYVESFKEF